jgi:hypothetical protein
VLNVTRPRGQSAGEYMMNFVAATHYADNIPANATVRQKLHAYGRVMYEMMQKPDHIVHDQFWIILMRYFYLVAPCYDAVQASSESAININPECGC